MAYRHIPYSRSSGCPREISKAWRILSCSFSRLTFFRSQTQRPDIRTLDYRNSISHLGYHMTWLLSWTPRGPGEKNGTWAFNITGESFDPSFLKTLFPSGFWEIALSVSLLPHWCFFTISLLDLPHPLDSHLLSSNTDFLTVPWTQTGFFCPWDFELALLSAWIDLLSDILIAQLLTSFRLLKYLILRELPGTTVSEIVIPLLSLLLLFCSSTFSSSILMCVYIAYWSVYLFVFDLSSLDFKLNFSVELKV